MSAAVLSSIDAGTTAGAELLAGGRYAEAMDRLRVLWAERSAPARASALSLARRAFYEYRCFPELIDFCQDCLRREEGNFDLIGLQTDCHAHLNEIGEARAALPVLIDSAVAPEQLCRVISLIPKIYQNTLRYEWLKKVKHRLDKLAPLPRLSTQGLIAHATLRLAMESKDSFHGLIDQARRGGLARESRDAQLRRLTQMADRAKAFEATGGNVPRVFGIGLSKTGTSSLHKALNYLGLVSAHWENPITGALLGDADIPYFDALCDTSISYRFEELYFTYPKACFIYTPREVGAWKRSMLKHYAALCRDHSQSFADMVRRHCNPNALQFGYDYYKIHASLYFNHPSLAEAHAVFDQRVRRFFADKPAARFLELDIIGGQGWPELCAFLGAPVPKESFPWAYKTKFVPSPA